MLSLPHYLVAAMPAWAQEMFVPCLLLGFQEYVQVNLLGIKDGGAYVLNTYL